MRKKTFIVTADTADPDSGLKTKYLPWKFDHEIKFITLLNETTGTSNRTRGYKHKISGTWL